MTEERFRPEDRLRCPLCGSNNVSHEDHPTAKGWHRYRCLDCGRWGGEHKTVPS